MLALRQDLMDCDATLYKSMVAKEIYINNWFIIYYATLLRQIKQHFHAAL